MPLPRAICKLLYVLCKVRGYKIISQLLSKEPQHLDRMLHAFQAWSHAIGDQAYSDEPLHGQMTWEERYVMLLWISHLLLVPFDLASMSSRSYDTSIANIQLPVECPSIARDLVSVSIGYLGSPSKEREAAKVLLVRLAFRTDMAKIELHRLLLDWALARLKANDNPTTVQSDYTFLGLLSFLAGFVSTANTQVIDPLFKPNLSCSTAM